MSNTATSVYYHALATQSKGLSEILDIVQNLSEITLNDLTAGEDEVEDGRKLTGTILQCKRPSSSNKMVTRAKAVSSKGEAQQRSTAYFRLMYVRFRTSMGIVVVKPGTESILLHLEGRLKIGQSVTVVDPVCCTLWNGLPIIETQHPLLPAAVSCALQRVPEGLLTSSSMKSFCIETDRLRILGVDSQFGCCHEYCDARYGTTSQCPGTSRRGIDVCVPRVRFRVPGVDGSWVPYVSRSLALAMFPETMLAYPCSKEPDFFAMRNFARKALLEHEGFRIVGWFKPEVKEGDMVTHSFKLHVSNLEVSGDDLPRFTTVPTSHAREVREDDSTRSSN